MAKLVKTAYKLGFCDVQYITDMNEEFEKYTFSSAPHLVCSPFPSTSSPKLFSSTAYEVEQNNTKKLNHNIITEVISFQKRVMVNLSDIYPPRRDVKY